LSDNKQANKGTSTGAAPLPTGYGQMVEFAKSKPLPLIAAGVATIGIMAGMVMWANAPDYRVMYSNISDADGGTIIDELQKRDIPYKLSDSGHSILVPSDKVNTLRLQLAEKGLPSSGNVGFELMDNQSFGVSQFAEQINFQRGLEGELVRSIESLGPVAKARVHLVMPKNSVFARDREAASASVVITLHSGRELGPGQVESIKYLISSSVPHLPAESVTVVDQSGRLLSKPGRNGEALDGTQLNYTEEVETSFQRRIETILAPILGSQNVKAQVVAKIDFSSREQTNERYGPNQPPNEAAVRSQQVSESYSGDGDLAKGVPGALTNSPPNAPAITTPTGGKPDAKGNAKDAKGNAKNTKDAKDAKGAKATSQAEDTSEMSVAQVAGKQGTLNRDKTINYEVDRNIEHTKLNTGGLIRLSAAVVVNYKTVVVEGETKQVALTEEEMKNVNRLVRQAMGFSGERGDEVEVVNSPFSVDKEVIEEKAWWKTPEFFSLMSMGLRYLLVAFAGLVSWFAVLRPLIRRQKRIQEIKDLREQEELSRLRAENEPAIIIEGSSDAITLRRKKPEYQHNMKGFLEMAKENPRLVVSVIHSWINKQNDQ
jgi:flagellar M-ring protein FliF